MDGPLCPFLCSGCRKLVFVRFTVCFNKYIHIWKLDMYVCHTGNFQMQKFSHDKFYPEPIIFRHFSFIVIYVHPKWLETTDTVVFYIIDFSRTSESGFLVHCPSGFSNITYLDHGGFSGAKIFQDPFRSGFEFALNWSFSDIFLTS